MKPKNKKIFIRAVVLPIVVFAGTVYFYMPKYSLDRSKSSYELSSPQVSLISHKSMILEDRAALEGVDFFRGSLGGSDAAQYLNQMVKFSDDTQDASLKLLPDLIEKMRSKEWYSAEIDMSVYLLDFSWMGKLHDFDVWSPEVANRRVNLDKRPDIASVPLPVYSELLVWAKLRLIQGRQSQTLPEALKDVRQLARLIFTNDHLVSALVSVNMLNVERVFLERHQTIRPLDWPVMSEDLLTRAKRYFYATSTFVDPRLSIETYKLFSSTKVGECVMVYEGMFPSHMMRDYLSEYYPVQIERFALTLKETRETCRIGLAQLAWEDVGWKSVQIAESDTNLAAFILLGISSPNMMKKYEEVKKK